MVSPCLRRCATPPVPDDAGSLHPSESRQLLAPGRHVPESMAGISRNQRPTWAEYTAMTRACNVRTSDRTSAVVPFGGAVLPRSLLERGAFWFAAGISIVHGAARMGGAARERCCHASAERAVTRRDFRLLDCPSGGAETGIASDPVYAFLINVCPQPSGAALTCCCASLAGRPAIERGRARKPCQCIN